MKPRGKLRVSFRCTIATFFLFTLWRVPAWAQDAAQKPVEEPAAKSPEKTATRGKAANPAQIELLETKVRFESNGDSRKDVHALVKINSELGVRQFAKLNFDYNRSFESIEIPLVHITHASGGTADILPSAVTDQPNPAVVNAPAYQDVRVKSVRILGLEPGDALEYRVITTVTHHPLAPDFWLDHTFDRTGVVTKEIFELDLPTSRFEGEDAKDSYPSTSLNPMGVVPTAGELFGLKHEPRLGVIYFSPKTPETSRENIKDGETSRLRYVWNTSRMDIPKLAGNAEPIDPDVVVTSFWSWEAVAYALSANCYSQAWPPAEVPSIGAQRKELLSSVTNDLQFEEAVYDFVSRKIRTIDLPLSSTGFKARSPSDTLSTGYGTAADKVALFIALLGRGKSSCSFVPNATAWKTFQLYRPSQFEQILVYIHSNSRKLYLDPGMEVAPFGLIRSDLRARDTLAPRDATELMGHVIKSPRDYYSWQEIPRDPPSMGSQKVNVDSILAADGKLTAKVHYAMRGDNELLLRVAFHQSPKEKWKELAQLLSITDGFRGQVTSVDASDPYATKNPFTLQYEIEQPKFVNWSKKTVRIPALLPQIGLPDLPAKPAVGAAASPINLGTPLDVETQMTLRLPPGTVVQTPTGTSVQRDYATYASQYSAKGLTITASRHIKFLLREIPADRAADYSAFLHAVQNDEAQDFTLEQANPASPPVNKTDQPKP